LLFFTLPYVRRKTSALLKQNHKIKERKEAPDLERQLIKKQHKLLDLTPYQIWSFFSLLHLEGSVFYFSLKTLYFAAEYSLSLEELFLYLSSHLYSFISLCFKFLLVFLTYKAS
jgi:hypothetical protein